MQNFEPKKSYATCLSDISLMELKNKRTFMRTRSYFSNDITEEDSEKARAHIKGNLISLMNYNYDLVTKEDAPELKSEMNATNTYDDLILPLSL